MKEAQWNSSTDPGAMLRSLRARRQNRPSERKMRLYCCACCRRLGPLLRDRRFQKAIDVAERHADGQASEDELWAVAQTITNDVDLSSTPRKHEVRQAISGVLWLPQHVTSLKCEYAAAEVTRWAAQASQQAEEPARQAELLRCVVGNPFRASAALDPAVLQASGGAVSRLAETAYENRQLPAGTLDGKRLAELADALAAAGCDDAGLLGHLRGPGPHVRGCFVLDRLLQKE
jgi:hypothetical protein